LTSEPGERVIAADALLTWEAREDVDRAVDRVLAEIDRSALGDVRIENVRLLTVARYRLRFELTHAILAFEAARAAVAEVGPVDVSDRSGPAALMLGARAGAGTAPPAELPSHWRPLYTPPPFEGPLATIGNVVQRAAAVRTRPANVRVAVVPGFKAGPALAATPRARIARAGVALLPFPWLSFGEAPRLALRNRLPTLPRARHRGARPPVSLPSMPRLVEDEALDAALAALVREALREAADEAREIAAALRTLDGLAGCRALVLPTSALGAARAAISWARERGVTPATVQHGFYVMRGLEDADEGAEVLFSWGPGVAEQAATWSAPPRDVTCIGLPGAKRAPDGAAPPERLRRLLIATSAGIAASALNPYSYAPALLDVVGPGLQTLAGSGVAIAVRSHPAERPSPYPELLARLGVRATVDEARPLGAALADADLVLTSASSVAFEAALSGKPCALWSGPLPAELRNAIFLPPFDRDLPSMFTTREEFGELTADALAGWRAFAERLESSVAELRRYVAPFDPDRFAAGLEALGR
jgi:hypothetical protein